MGCGSSQKEQVSIWVSLHICHGPGGVLIDLKSVFDNSLLEIKEVRMELWPLAWLDGGIYCFIISTGVYFSKQLLIHRGIVLISKAFIQHGWRAKQPHGSSILVLHLLRHRLHPKLVSDSQFCVALWRTGITAHSLVSWFLNAYCLGIGTRQSDTKASNGSSSKPCVVRAQEERSLSVGLVSAPHLCCGCRFVGKILLWELQQNSHHSWSERLFQGQTLVNPNANVQEFVWLTVFVMIACLLVSLCNVAQAGLLQVVLP